MHKKNYTLLMKFTSLFVIFATVLCVLLSATSYTKYKASMLAHHADYASSVAALAAQELDAAQLLHYAKTKQIDETYVEIHEKLLSIQRVMKVEFLYVQMPISEDTVLFLFDAYNLADSSESNEYALGTTDNYNDDFSTAKEAIETGFPAAKLEITKSQHGYLASAYAPIANAEGNAIAYVGVDIDMGSIVAFLQAYLLFAILSTLVLVAICFAFLLLLLRRTVLRPLANIADKASTFTTGIADKNFDPLQINSTDEIGSLASSFNQMFADIKNYTAYLATVTANNQRIEDDLKTARSIQKGLLPNMFPPYLAYTDVEIFAKMTPAENVSGGFYDCFPIDKDHLAFVIADATGTGVASALFMMAVHTLIKNRAVSGHSPRAVFESLNAQLCSTNKQNMAATAFLGIYDSRNNILSYSNAGHSPPIIKRSSGSTAWLPVNSSSVLGLEEKAQYTTQVETMMPGDCLLLYTNAVPHAKNATGQEFSSNTLMQLMSKININSLVPQQIVEMIESATLNFTQSSICQNDIILMLMRRL